MVLEGASWGSLLGRMQLVQESDSDEREVDRDGIINRGRQAKRRGGWCSEATGGRCDVEVVADPESWWLTGR